MDEVLKRRLVGASALMGAVLLISWVLPSPTDAPPVESGQTTVTFDLTQPEIARLPPAKLPAPVTPLPQTIAEPVQEPLQTLQSSPPEPDEVQPPEQDPDRQSFLAAKPRIVESVPDAEPVAASPVTVATAPADKAPAPDKPLPKPEPKPALPKPVTVQKSVTPTQTPVVAAPPKPEAAKPAVAVTPPKPVSAPVVAQKPAVPPATPAKPSKPSKPAVPVSRFFAQVGSFTEIDGARRTQEQLKSQNFKSLISPADTPAGTRYRVRVGPYPSREAAIAARDSLVGKGYASPTVIED